MEPLNTPPTPPPAGGSTPPPAGGSTLPPSPPGMRPVAAPSSGSGSKVMWAVLVLLVVAAAAAAWYFFGDALGIPTPKGFLRSSTGPSVESTLPPPAPTEDEMTMKLKAQGTSDDLGSIEQDLQATDLDGLDQELSDIDAQLQ